MHTTSDQVLEVGMDWEQDYTCNELRKWNGNTQSMHISV